MSGIDYIRVQAASTELLLCASLCETTFHSLCKNTPGWTPSAAYNTCFDACETQLKQSPMNIFQATGLGGTVFSTLSAGENIAMCRQFVDDPVAVPETAPEKAPEPSTGEWFENLSPITVQIMDRAGKLLPYITTGLTLVGATILWVESGGTAAGMMMNVSGSSEKPPSSL